MGFIEIILDLYEIILDLYEIITSYVRYDNDHIYPYLTAYPMYGKYKPSKDLFHYEDWKNDGDIDADWTNDNRFWSWFYYPRNHKNIPNNENIYKLNLKYYYDWYDTRTLWA